MLTQLGLMRSLGQTFLAVTLAAIGPHGGPTLPPKPEGDVVPKCSKLLNKCWWVPRSIIKIPGVPSKPGKPPTHQKVTKPECNFHGVPQACTDSFQGNWSNSHQCYMRRETPDPPFDDPRWKGHTDGSIWACTREQGYDKGKHLITEWVWLPGKPDTVVVDPVTLAYEAIAEMQLAPPLIKTAPAPGQIGLVNMPVWMWVTQSESTWGPIVRSASVPGLSVTATARVKAIDWSMGDGSTVRCDGPGTPYDKSVGVKNSPTCGHRYVKTSRKLPNCKYPVTAVAQWEITWESTLGDTGQIGMTQQAATQLRIGEAVPVIVDPGGGDASAPGAGGC
ncbi:hypothetical protein ACFV9C_24815 [Kribbella sp. NPDC059898]|uniref:hypothetical protein n=1 Tax=Kribbella sp. NPDC059898 TaxID=3346995 RepID=UPI003662628C